MELKREFFLNGNKIIVDWTRQPLSIQICKDISISDGEEMITFNAAANFSEDDIHTILRAINEVRTKWKILQRNGSCST